MAKCDEGSIIKSKYNWSELVSKYKRIGIRYYTETQLSKGQFLNLLVLEVHKNGFALYDLDDIEGLILKILDTPTSIEKILLKMKRNANEEIIKSHLEKYNELIMENIKQLVLKKIIKPF